MHASETERRILLACGYTDAQIRGMSRPEVENELRDAADSGAGIGFPRPAVSSDRMPGREPKRYRLSTIAEYSGGVLFLVLALLYSIENCTISPDQGPSVCTSLLRGLFQALVGWVIR